MDFEQLLRKYLSGAITEPELEQFQALLDRVPEYKAELRETLEIRSLLHDDALTLTTPADLSDHIRIAVGSSFAADALVEQEEQARRRRVFLNPLRVSVGALVAACVMVGVALTPTLRHNLATVNGSLARTAAPAATATAGAVASADASKAAPIIASTAAPSLTPSNGTARAAHGTPEGSRASGRGIDVVKSAEGEDRIADAGHDILADDMWMIGHEVPTRSGHQQDGAERSSSGIAQNEGGMNEGSGNVTSTMGQVNYASMLSRDPAQLLKRDLGRPSYNPTLDSTVHRQFQPAQLEPKPGEMMAMTGGEGRRLTIGVTLGAGQVAETETPTALMQNSYYLSFTLGSADRIGVEMGASAFQQERRTNDPYSKRINNDPLLLSANPNHGSGEQYGLVGTDDVYLGKKTLGVPSTDEAPTSSPTPTRTPVPQQQTDEGEHFEQQQITYGAVFYDRRIQLNKSWDLCGRVTFGGADNAVMGNVRAYAAFTPTSKNITFTMGVGGATLYNLRGSQGSNSSVNYGIYYGIETGF